MWNMVTLQTIGVMIVCSGIGVILTRKFHLPHIVLYILTGLFLGQLEIAFLDKELLKESQSAVQIISEAGIALLLFLVGMELSLTKIKDVGKVALIAGLGQIVFTAFFGTILGLLMGFPFMESLVLGAALTFSSTVVVVKLLGEKKHINTLYGRISIGIFLVQDMVVIFFLTIMAGMSDTGLAGGWKEVAWNLGKAFLGMSLLLFMTLAFAKIFLRRIMRWGSSSTEFLFILSLTWCFLIVYIAHSLQLSKEIGAFLAGVSLAQLSLSNSLKQRIHPLMNFFVGIFFISLGMSVDLSSAFQNWTPSVIFSLFVLAGNPLIFIIIILKNGYNERVAFLAGVTVAQISEFSFVFAALGYQKGLIGKDPLTIITFVGLITIIISSYMILYNERLFYFMKKTGVLKVFRGSQKRDPGEFPMERIRNHVIVIGMNSLGRIICSRLSESGYKVLAIDNDPEKLKDLPCEHLVGNADYASILEEASFESAKLVVTTLRIEDVNNSIVYRCKNMKIPVAAHGFDSSVIPDLIRLETDYIIDSKSSWLRKLFKKLNDKGVALP